MIPELTTSHRVVVFYLPLSKGPFAGADDSGKEYSFDFIAASLHSVLTELDLPSVHLVGESFGGAVAQHFTLQHPDRVASLAIISSLCRTEVTPIVQVTKSKTDPCFVCTPRQPPSHPLIVLFLIITARH